jgi:hypothetical protein
MPPTRITSVEQVEDVFTYHAPTPEQQRAYIAIREQAKQLVACLLAYCHDCGDRDTAIQKVREAVHMANASVALVGRV